MAHPLLHHMQRDAIGGGIDAKAMTQPLWASMRGIRNACCNHHLFHDLPDAYAADRPYLLTRAALRLLRFADTVRRVERVQELWWHGHCSEHKLLVSAGQVPLLEAADRHGAACQVDPSWGEFNQLRRSAACVMQGFADRSVTGWAAARGGQEEVSFFGIEIEPVAVPVVQGQV